MTVKERLREVIEDLPDDATLDDVMERLYIAVELERRMQEIDEGSRGVPEDEVFARLRQKWAK